MLNLFDLMQIHIQRGETSLGSFSLEETTQYLNEGRLLESDLAWHEGLDEWMSVGQVFAQLGGQDEVAQATEGSFIEEPPTFGQGRYRCQQLLGQGGMGQVWLAYDEQLERLVALKTLHQHSATDVKALKELKEEVQKCLELTHPNIIRIYDLAEPPGEDSFISMEYVSGEDLREKLNQHPESYFSWREIEPHILSLCEALEYAHDQGMVHRDLKPQNLMVTNENQLKLADFGIAATTSGDGEQAVPRAGTPVYWGPQQAQGMTPSPTDDIYSLGITLYHLLAGEAPFLGSSEPEITRQHLQDDPMHPQKKLEALGRKGKIPEYVSDLILKCLAKKPTERFQRASEVKAWIEAKGDPAAKKQKRMAMVAVASVALMLIMTALSVWSMAQKKKAVEAKTAETKQRQEAEEQRSEALKQKGIAETKQKEAEAELKRANLVAGLVTGIFTAVNPEELETVDDRDKDLMKLLLAKSAKKINELENVPSVERSFRKTLGKAYESLGFYQLALVQLEKVLDLNLQKFGPDDARVALSRIELGGVYTELGNPDKALEHFNQALALILDKLEQNQKWGATVGSIYINIGNAYRSKGEYDKALDFFYKNHDLILKNLDSDHDVTHASFHRIAQIHREKGDYEKALEIWGKLTAEKLKKYPPNHPKFRGLYNSLGVLHMQMDNAGKALKFLLKTLPIHIKTLGPKHPRVALLYNNIAAVYGRKGEEDKALGFYNKALGILKERRGAGHPEVALCYDNIGRLYTKQKKYRTAIEFLEKAMAIRMKSLKPDHPDMAGSCESLAEIYAKNGNPEKALQLYNIAVNILVKNMGPDYPSIAQNLLDMGFIYKDKNNLPKAMECFERAYEIALKSFGPDHSVSLRSKTHYWSLVQKLDPRKAVEFYEAVLVRAEKGDADAQNDIGHSYWSGNGATKDIREAIKWFTKAAEQGHPVAQYNVGFNHDHVSENLRDPIMAYKWYTICFKNSADIAYKAITQEAKSSRAILAKEMTAEQITKAEALADEMIKMNPKLIRKK